MAFKKGQSGNPRGKKKGVISKRTQIARLLEPHAKKIVAKVIEMALSGDSNALRLCVERIIPRAQREVVTIHFPHELNQENLPKFREMVIRSTFAGELTIDDSEKLIKLATDQVAATPLTYTPANFETSDPMVLSRAYQDLMMVKK